MLHSSWSRGESPDGPSSRVHAGVAACVRSRVSFPQSVRPSTLSVRHHTRGGSPATPSSDLATCSAARIRNSVLLSLFENFTEAQPTSTGGGAHHGRHGRSECTPSARHARAGWTQERSRLEGRRAWGEGPTVVRYRRRLATLAARLSLVRLAGDWRSQPIWRGARCCAASG